MSWFKNFRFKLKGGKKTDSQNYAPVLGIEEFVRESIVGVMSGIQGAQKKYSKENSAFAPLICPAWLPFPLGNAKGHSDKIYELEFDLAVTLTENSSSKAEGKIGLTVVGLYKGKLGCSAESGGGRESINRMRFTIPIRYPLAEVMLPNYNNLSE